MQKVGASSIQPRPWKLRVVAAVGGRRGFASAGSRRVWLPEGTIQLPLLWSSVVYAEERAIDPTDRSAMHRRTDDAPAAGSFSLALQNLHSNAGPHPDRTVGEHPQHF